MGRKLRVEVCDAKALLPKDGQESASPYCIIDYDGQRRKTEMRNQDPNPICNSKYEFVVSDLDTMDNEVLEINVYSEKKSMLNLPTFLGRVRIPGYCFVKQGEEAIVYYPLRGRNIFSNVKGELGVKVWYFDEERYDPPILILPPPPPVYAPRYLAGVDDDTEEDAELIASDEDFKPMAKVLNAKAAPALQGATPLLIPEAPTPVVLPQEATPVVHREEPKVEVRTLPRVVVERKRESETIQQPPKAKKADVVSYYSVPRDKKKKEIRKVEEQAPMFKNKEEASPVEPIPCASAALKKEPVPATARVQNRDPAPADPPLQKKNSPVKSALAMPPHPDPPPAPPDNEQAPKGAAAQVTAKSPAATAGQQVKDKGKGVAPPAFTNAPSPGTPQEKKKGKKVHWGTRQMEGEEEEAIGYEGLVEPDKTKKKKRHAWQIEGEEEEAIGYDGLIGLIDPEKWKEKERLKKEKQKLKEEEETKKFTQKYENSEPQKEEVQQDIKVKQQEQRKEAEEREEIVAQEQRQQDFNAQEIKRNKVEPCQESERNKVENFEESNKLEQPEERNRLDPPDVRNRLDLPTYSHPSDVDPADYALKDVELATPQPLGEKSATHDLVENMQYLFVRVVKAKQLGEKQVGGSCDAYVKVSIGNQSVRTRAIHKNLNPTWNQVFAFGKERMGGQNLEVTVWAEDTVDRDEFLGSVSFDVAEIPTRRQPDSPLAPQWYRLEETRDGRVKGDIMLAVWMGAQSDEAFAEAWQSDSGDYANTRSKVYMAPKLWYIRVTVVEAQDVEPIMRLRSPELSVRGQLGFQILKTSFSRNSSTSPSWNEDLLFVASEPFEDDLILTIEDRVSLSKEDELGYVRIPLRSIERRVDARPIASRWFDVERIQNSKSSLHGRMHLCVCFEGGYHVMDEPMNSISCVRPTAKQLWKPSIGLLELGIICAKGIVPMKTRGGKGTTDAYCVAKYGQKWVRTRTIVDNFNPRWNEQYTWEVHDPCTVITVAVMDNWHLHFNPDEKDSGDKDGRIGKVRIRLSALERNRVYTNRYPLLMLQQLGVKKMGVIELAVRFSTSSFLETLQLYSEPVLPKLHYSHPLDVAQTEKLRLAAVKVSSNRLSRSEPPLRPEVVQYVLEPDSNAWSLRRSRTNYNRILNVLSEPLAIFHWFHGICTWRNKYNTVAAHIIFCFLACFPRLIMPLLLVLFFLKGAWLFRYRARLPPSIDAKLSQADQVDPDELDEEFDPIPSTKDPEILRARYDRLRVEAAKVQNVLGDLATEGERLLALFTWRDPRATLISTLFWLALALLLYLTPIRLAVLLVGFYIMRHPSFRQPLPSIPFNFYRRLPSLKDQIL